MTARRRTFLQTSAHGRHGMVNDDRNIPDTMEVAFGLPSGTEVVFGICAASGSPGLPHGEIELRGTKGTLHVSEDACRIPHYECGQPWSLG